VITLKQDWFTEELEEAGILVGGGRAIAKKLHLEDSQISFRFAVSPNSTWMYFLTVGFGPDYSSLYEKHIILNLRELAVSAIFPDLKIIFFSDHRPGSFRINFEGIWETVSESELQKRFYTMDPSFTGELGHVKPINKSINDAFQVWSRTFLSPKCVVNDLDALAVGQKRNKIIELKRPIEDVAEWKPYRNDLSNYHRNSELALKTSSEIINIAYNQKSTSGKLVQIFTTPVNDVNSRIISYSKLVISSKEAIDFILDIKQILLIRDSSQR
jgi:hypothetical protein